MLLMIQWMDDKLENIAGEGDFAVVEVTYLDALALEEVLADVLQLSKGKGRVAELEKLMEHAA